MPVAFLMVMLNSWMPCSGGSMEMAPLIPVRMCVDLDQLLVVDEVETSK